MTKINIFPLTPKQHQVRLRFWTQKQPHCNAVSLDVLKKVVFKTQGKKLPDQKVLYTDWLGQEGGDLTIEVNLQKNSFIDYHVYNKLLEKVAQSLFSIVESSFVGTIKGWKKVVEHPKYHEYKRFGFKVIYNEYTDLPHLRISFEGIGRTTAKSVEDLPEDSLRYMRRFRYEKSLVNRNWKVLPEGMDRSNAFPVISKPLGDRLEVALHRKSSNRNAYAEALQEIDLIKQELFEHPSFLEVFEPVQKGVHLEIEPSSIGRVSPKYSYIIGACHQNDTYPPNVIRKGPAVPISNQEVKVFFLIHKDDQKSVGNTLAGAMLGKYSHIGDSFTPMTGLTLKFNKTHLVYENESNPMPEIEAQFDQLLLEPHTHYFAFYISRISKYDTDLDRKRVYYRVKEYLLHKGICSQVIMKENVHAQKHFRYSLQNIFVSMLAKLGGIPWKLSVPLKEELIVGIGAYRPSARAQNYIGSAVCFNAQGQFDAFDCFSENDTFLLAGAIEEALYSFLSVHTAAKRLIIHLYKELSDKDLHPIQEMLHSLDLSIPVLIVSIYDSRTKDYMVFDEHSEHRLPLNGTYVPIPFTNHRYLLYNNMHYSAQQTPKKFHFPLHLKVKSTHPELLSDPKVMDELMAQVVQLSRVYYKSLNFQPMPVTVKYPQLVAQQFPHFDSYTLPEHGRRSLWFL